MTGVNYQRGHEYDGTRCPENRISGSACSTHRVSLVSNLLSSYNLREVSYQWSQIFSELAANLYKGAIVWAMIAT